MNPDDKALALAARIADGSGIDWPTTEATPADADERALLEELKAIAEVATAHRTPAVWPTDAASLAGTRWGPLTLLTKVGEGRFGTVYAAWDARLQWRVALKLLHGASPTASASPTSAIEEARLLARVRHPNVLTVHGAESIDGQVGIWTEFIEGRTLESLVTERGPLPPEEVVAIGLDLCRALAAVHEAGLLHRDIKAQNVMRETGGRIVLMDFGTGHDLDAAATSGGDLSGTPLYLAPELYAGGRATPGSDIYALAVLLFHLLTGQYPVSGRTLDDVRTGHRAGRAGRLHDLRPGLPNALVDAIERGLTSDPDARYDCARAFEAGLAGTCTPLTRDIATQRPRWTSRHTRLAGIAPAVMIAALSLGDLTLHRTAKAMATPSAVLEHRDDQAITFGPQTRLASHSGLEINPAMSPDGRYVAYSAGIPGHMLVIVREIASGHMISLTDDAHGATRDERRPRWSPQGTRVLFTDGDALYTGYVGGVLRGDVAAAFITRSSFIRSAEWTPDGGSILFVAGDSLFRVASAGGTPQAIRPLDDRAYSLSISPDGARIAYASGNPDFDTGTTQFANIGPSVIRVAPIGGGSAVDVTDNQHLNTSPIWSPDGRSLFFVSDREGRRDVYVVGLDAGGMADNPRRLTTGLDAHTMSLSANGRTLAYSLFTRQANIWGMSIPDAGTASTKDAVPITSGNQTIEEMLVSPDRQSLTFDSDVNGRMNLYRVPIGGGEPQQLTHDSSDDFVNAVSPNGQSIAFHSFRNGRRELYVMPSGGGPETFVAVGQSAAWSPDSSRLVFGMLREASYDPSGVGTMMAGWAVVKRNGQGGWASQQRMILMNCDDIEWRPDGQTFFGVCKDGLQILAHDGTVLRHVYAPRRGTSDPIPKTARRSPDGRTVYFKSYDQEGRASFWSIPAVGGTPRLILRCDDPQRPSNRTGFDTDGMSLYFTIDDRQSEVWVVDVAKGTR